MASILKVDTLQKPDGSTPTAADLGIDVAGSVVGVKRHFHAGATQMTTTTWTGVGQQVTYTPKYPNSILIVQHTCLMRGSASGISDGRFDWRILRNGVDLIEEPTPLGQYVYSGGIWLLQTYTYNEIHYCTDTSEVTWDWQVKSSNDSGTAELYWNEGYSAAQNYEGGRGSTTVIYEIAQ